MPQNPLRVQPRHATTVPWGATYLPNGMIKNDFETILMLRKTAGSGKRGYRTPTPEMEAASQIGKDEYSRWFRAIWDDIRGESLRNHPAPFPKEVTYRLIRMFSFACSHLLAILCLTHLSAQGQQ